MSKNLLSNLIINLKDYQVEYKIGGGTYGKVYLIQKKKNKKIKYAMKVSKSIVDTEEKKNEFINEIKALIIAKYPSILPMIGFSYTSIKKKQKPTIIMKYAVNGSLQDVLLNLTPTQKYIILLGIAKGMNYLHKHGIVHRDLKPLNVLIDENFYPLICDFGESKITYFHASDLKMESEKGTLAFRAPEATTQEQYDLKIDVFSFALLFYSIYFERYPYENYPNQISFHMAMCSGQRPDLSQIQNQIISDLIKKCWNASASLRPSFREIVEEMSKDQFRQAMNANKADVENYLSLFNDEAEEKSVKSPMIIQIDADNGDVDEMYNLALLYLYGNDMPKNIPMALNYFNKAADSGNEKAMYIYAYMVYHGYGTIDDHSKALKYIKMAAEKNNLNASQYYAVMLFCGMGIDEKKDEAIQCLKDAADKGNKESCYYYAQLLYNGIEVEQNKVLACSYFKVSADVGYVQAMLNYATMKFYGDGVEIDENEALNYYKIASSKNDKESLEKFCIEHHQKMIDESAKLIEIYNSYKNRKGSFLRHIGEAFDFFLKFLKIKK